MYMENKERTITDLFHLGGDSQGVASTLSLGKNYDARVHIIYQDKLLVGEIYKHPEGAGFFLNLTCPRCLNVIKIDTARKEMAYEPGRGLDVAPFRCTWELGERNNERIAFGLSMCNWTVGVSSCQRTISTSEGEIVVDGIARDA